MGTPEFARIVMEHVLDWPLGEIVGVYTQPDRPSGRGRSPKPSPVKLLSIEKGLSVYQPENFKDRAEVDRLKAAEPDYLLVAAYGLILPEYVLKTAKEMPLNVHASLLPLYRGAAPIQRAIINGEKQTGISIMRLTPGMDTGPVLMRRTVDIEGSDTAQTLHDKLARIGGELLVQVLNRLQGEELPAEEQDHELATYAPKLTKKEALINWDRPAGEVHDLIRGMFPWPGAYFFWTSPEGRPIRIIVYPGKVGNQRPVGVKPGTLTGVEQGYLGIVCRDRIYLTPKVKPENSKEMSAQGFYCGFLQKCR